LLCIGCWKFLCPYWLLQVEQHLLDMDLHYFLLWSLQKKNFFFLQMRSWPRGMAQVVHNLPSKLWVQIPVPSKRKKKRQGVRPGMVMHAWGR
jgi:hypothetical protein